MALHRTAEPLSGTVSVFRNSIADFIFAGITGDALGLYQVIEFRQSDAVYRGFEVEAHLEVGSAEVVADVAYVDARLTTTGEYLPRIPRSAAPWNSRSPPVTTGSPRGCAGPPAWIGCTSAKPPPMGSEC